MRAEIEIRPIAVDGELLALLQSCNINLKGVTSTDALHFYGHQADNTLLGAVGLEVYGEMAMLRSLAVTPQARGAGMGQALVRFVEQEAARQKVEELFLLTITAAPFFAKLGYEALPREAAPASIKATEQYRGLCPADATLMRKSLSDSA